MAKKQQRPPPIEEPPTASSSSDEDDASSSSSEEDQQPPTLSQSSSEPENAPLKAKPLASKPKAQSSSVPIRSALKRPVAVENNNNAQRAKKKKTSDDVDDDDDDGKKSEVDDSKKVFQRVWSEEDEITIVKGLAEFTSNTGTDPVKDVDALYDAVKKSLHFDASRKQLREKIRRLKDKFRANAKKKGKNGEDPTFFKPHEQKLFELSKKVWGNEEEEKKGKGKADVSKPPKSPKKEASRRSTAAALASSSKKQPPTKQPVPETGEELDSVPLVAFKDSGNVKTDNGSLILSETFHFDKVVGLNGLNGDVVKRGLELMGESNRAELEVRWKKLHVAEMELFVERVQLIKGQTKLILEAYKSSTF